MTSIIRSEWKDDEAEQYKTKYAKYGPELALRVYTSRLIGRDPNLVLHGGGNTSVKIKVPLDIGEEASVIAVKGSGWELGTIEPQGFPCVDLNHCRKLRKLNALDDRDMVNHLRSHMLDCDSPTPSVETLLHAFLPHKYIDHSHADSMLAILDQPEEVAIEICKKLYGNTFGIVPYIMPGFDLALKAGQVFDQDPTVKGLLLLKHGLFTFADTAKESYENHIEAIAKAQAYISSFPRKTLTPALDPSASIAPHKVCKRILPLLRGILRKLSNINWVLVYRKSQKALEFANSKEVTDWSQRGTLTPDHVIRTKGFPLVLQDLRSLVADKASDKQLESYLEQQVNKFVQDYHTYFQTQNQKSSVKKVELDPFPRVLLIQDVGLVTAGMTHKEASIAADIYEHTIDTILDANSVNHYEPVSEKDRFDMEYWSLEQAKLGKTKPATLEGQVVYITGGASGIGLACAHHFGKAGANVFIVDMDKASLEKAATSLKANKIPVHTKTVDISSSKEVRKSFTDVIMAFGGVDILINNAGKSFQSDGMAECSEETLKASFDVNFFGHQYCSAAAVKIMKKQRHGVLLFNVSKAALNPGKNFGPYCVAKAALLALMKQYALEYASFGIRSNAVNADRVHTSFFSEELIKERAAARKLEPSEYFKANLLHTEVEAIDVANAFLHLTLSTKTTAGILTVDGGNIEASVR